ncbi:uncharacterized protein LOC120473221 isoform X2 [Pimephales promelas]|uniref:uncharacterized protein LOC120473221 isoform X2 n=1 Tax=Pimephales promelas TaxID=90988 RepID=UPI0019555425|nr:uncharacterized protein LOC120473221 isoform X2 [Pimephales promelas]
MPWTMGILLFIMSVTMLSSSLRAGPESFFEMGAPYGVVSENTVRLGKLLIGAQGVVSEEEMEISGLRSAEQSHEYRSNEEERFRLAKAKLRRLGPSVHCGNDSMTLRIPGSRTPHFLVDRGIESPVPLSEMPASCGFSLKRARRDVSLGAPYQGCHVRKQGGRYILPLFIMGAPMQMSCPVSPPLPTVSCSPSGMMISLGVRPDDVKVKVDGSWQPLLQAYSRCSFMLESVDGSLVVTAPFIGRCWDIKDADMQLHLMYGDRQVTLSCPWTKPMLAPITDGPLLDPFGSQQMFYPFHGYAGHNFHGRPGVRPIPPTLPPTTPSPLQDPNQQMFPQMYPWPMLDPYYSNSGGFPAVPQRQQSKYPMFRHHMHHFKNPVKAATPPTPPPAAQFDQFMGYPPRYPKFYGPKPFVHHHVQYPFMPKYPQDQVFPPHSPNPASSPVGSQSMIFD